MVRPLFVAVADLHFDEYGAWKYKGITGDAAFGLSQVVDYCLDHAPGSLWLLGDLMNRPTPRQAAVRELCNQLDRLEGDGTFPTYYILGDHDGHQDWPALHPWPRHTHEVTLSLGAFTAYGLDYLPRGRLQAALGAIPADVQVLFTHQKWIEFVHRSGQARLDEVPQHVRYVITGDFHDHVWGEFGDGRQVWSPGSTHATSVGDCTPRHFLVGFADGDRLTCEFRPLRSRPLHRVVVTDATSLADLVGPGIDRIVHDSEVAGLPEQVRRPIVDVQYFGDIPGAYAQLHTLTDRCFLFLRPRDRNRERHRVHSPGRTTLAIEEAVGLLARPGTPGHDWTLRLLSAHDKRVEWRAIVEETIHARGAIP